MSCSAHVEEETRIWKPPLLRFCWIISFHRNYNKCEHKNLKSVFSVLFLSWATSSLYSWQSFSLYTASEVYNLSMATTNWWRSTGNYRAASKNSI